MRKVIAQKSGIPEDQQRLIYKAKLLKDDDLLSAYIKDDDETLHLIRKPAAAAAPSQAAPQQPAQSQARPGAAGQGAPIPGMPNLAGLLQGMMPPGGAQGNARINISMGAGGAPQGMPDL